MTKINDVVKRSILLKMAEHDEHTLVNYKMYHQFLSEIDRLIEARHIANDTVDDTLSIDQVIQHYEKRVNNCSLSLNYVADKLGLDVSEGVKFKVFI